MVEGSDKHIYIIADEDLVVGFLLCGVGLRDPRGNCNFLAVTQQTSLEKIELAFADFTARSDAAILIVAGKVGGQLRLLMDSYSQKLPILVEIPL